MKTLAWVVGAFLTMALCSEVAVAAPAGSVVGLAGNCTIVSGGSSVAARRTLRVQNGAEYSRNNRRRYNLARYSVWMGLIFWSLPKKACLDMSTEYLLASGCRPRLSAKARM